MFYLEASKKRWVVNQVQNIIKTRFLHSSKNQYFLIFLNVIFYIYSDQITDFFQASSLLQVKISRVNLSMML